MNNNRIVVQSTHEKTHVENCFLLAKYACPPLVSKKLQAPPGDSFAYYYRPPLAEGQGGVWDLQSNAAPTWGRKPRPPMGIWVGLFLFLEQIFPSAFICFSNIWLTFMKNPFLFGITPFRNT